MKHLDRGPTSRSVDFCDLGERSCKRFKTKGACQQPECPLVVAERKKKTPVATAAQSTDFIDVDMPFSFAEVAAATSEAYADALGRSDMAVAGRWNSEKATGRKVLVVDDEVVAANSVRRTLNRRGFRVDEAFSGREALNRILNEMCDLVLLDMRMPDTNGLELLPTIKKHRPALPVVMVTGLRVDRHGRRGHPARRERLRRQAVHAGGALQRRQQGDSAGDRLESSAHGQTRAMDQARPGRVGHGDHHGPRRRIPQRLRRGALAARLPLRLHQARLRRQPALARLDHAGLDAQSERAVTPRPSRPSPRSSLVLLWAASHLVASDAEPGVALAAAAVFATSPFVVMAAHFAGYLDHLFLAAAFAAAWLARSGRVWCAAALAAVGRAACTRASCWWACRWS
ncbi:MAG: response regulator [Desulfobacterales bacterium]|nr:response regulator [Desulfobacterales bacterium]